MLILISFFLVLDPQIGSPEANVPCFLVRRTTLCSAVFCFLFQTSRAWKRSGKVWGKGPCTSEGQEQGSCFLIGKDKTTLSSQNVQLGSHRSKSMSFHSLSKSYFLYLLQTHIYSSFCNWFMQFKMAYNGFSRELWVKHWPDTSQLNLSMGAVSGAFGSRIPSLTMLKQNPPHPKVSNLQQQTNIHIFIYIHFP